VLHVGQIQVHIVVFLTSDDVVLPACSSALSRNVRKHADITTTSTTIITVTTRAVIGQLRPPPRRIYGLDPAGYGLRIRTTEPNYFQNLMGTSLSKDTSEITFSSKSDHSVRRYKPNGGNLIPYLAMLKNPSKNSWIRKRMNSKVNQFFLVHRYICGKIFLEIRSVSFM